MIRKHIEFQVEEDSMEASLDQLLPKLIGDRATWRVIPYRGKQRLLRELPKRLRAYSRRVSSEPHLRVVVLVDNDECACTALKAWLEDQALRARLVTKSSHAAGSTFHVLNRVVVQELEAWFFGDPEAIRAAYPSFDPALTGRRGYRDPDAIGRTWERLHQALARAGHLGSVYPKIEVARRISANFVPERNRSRSFRVFVQGLQSMLSDGCF